MPVVSPLAGPVPAGPGVHDHLDGRAAAERVRRHQPVPCKAQNSVGGQQLLQPAGRGRPGRPAAVLRRLRARLRHRLRRAVDAAERPATWPPPRQTFGIGAGWQLQVDSQLRHDRQPDRASARSPRRRSARAASGSARWTWRWPPGLVQSGTWHAALAGLRPARPRSPSPPVQPPRSSTSLRKPHAGHRHAAARGRPPTSAMARSTARSAPPRRAPWARGCGSAWFVGYQGSVAFAILEFTKSPDTSAATLAGRFLTNMHG